MSLFFKYRTSLRLKKLNKPKRIKRFAFSRALESPETKEYINCTVNDMPVKVPKGAKILDACKIAKEYVPTLCYHPMLSIVGQCRLCMVRVNDSDKLKIACATTCEEGMKIETDVSEVNKTVKNNLQLLRCRHPNACMTCESNGRCEFQNLVYRFQVEEILPQFSALKDVRHNEGVDKSSNSLVRDMSKCVLCTRCIRACSEVQGMNILGMIGRGYEEMVGTVNNLPINETACINCGQCTAVCPVGALTEKMHVHYVEYGLKHKRKNGKIWVASIAPAVRVAISEEFDLAPGTASTGRLVTSLRQLGFDYVFDTNFTADLTIVEEATEFVNRVVNKGVFPMFTSCCPAWVNLIEKTYPDLEAHFSTCKSPQGMMGTLIKTYFADKLKVDPDRIAHVSIMPCVAKKDEIKRPQLKTKYIDNTGEEKEVWDTDYVLTTREIARLIHSDRIPFSSLPDGKFDDPLGITTGAAAIFGVTGGVLEAALRTAVEYVTGEKLQKIDFQEIRGTAGIREAELDVGGIKIRVAVAHGTKKVRQLVDQVREGKSPYHLIEVMACPGGCVGGGGEPKTGAVDADILIKRIQGIYMIDKNMPLRKSHENPQVKQLYEEFLKCKPGEHKAHELLHTHYTDRSGQVKARMDVTEIGSPPPIDATHEY